MTTPFIKATAKVLAASVEAYHELKSDKACEKALREQVLVIIRFATNHMPADPTWSVKVAELAAKKGINLQRFARNPKMSARFLGDKNEELPPEEKVTYEHMVTVSQMMKAVIAHPEDAEAILSSAQIVWITKAEDDKLRQLGFLKDRPNPEEAYAKAGIKIV